MNFKEFFSELGKALEQSKYLQALVIRWLILGVMCFFTYLMVQKATVSIECNSLLSNYIHCTSNGFIFSGKYSLYNDVLQIELKELDPYGDHYILEFSKFHNYEHVKIYSIHGGSSFYEKRRIK